ncbi:MAG: hypothetical protein ABIU06_18810, partial [Anaerolineales bacterium]
CQNVFGYPCAAWHSCSAVLLNMYGARLTSFNIILVLPFREVLHMIMVVIGRGEHTDETTDRMVGYVIIAIPIALWLGIISWPLVTKMIRRLSDLFFNR